MPFALELEWRIAKATPARKFVNRRDVRCNNSVGAELFEKMYMGVIRIKVRISQIIIVLLIVGIGATILYFDQIHDPFILSSTTYTSPEDAPEFIGTYKKHTFSIQNKSKYSMKLIDIKLEKYNGIEVGEILTQTGKIITEQGLVVPSGVVEYDENSWGTKGDQTFQYDVLINNPNIANPKYVLLTYKIFGLKLTQQLELPPFN